MVRLEASDQWTAVPRQATLSNRSVSMLPHGGRLTSLERTASESVKNDVEDWSGDGGAEKRNACDGKVYETTRSNTEEVSCRSMVRSPRVQSSKIQSTDSVLVF